MDETKGKGSSSTINSCTCGCGSHCSVTSARARARARARASAMAVRRLEMGFRSLYWRIRAEIRRQLIKKQPFPTFHYDPFSYALNFDDTAAAFFSS